MRTSKATVPRLSLPNDMVRKVKGSWWVDFQIRGKRYRLRSPDNHRDGAVDYEHVLRRRLSDGKNVFLASDPRAKLRPPSEERFGAFAAEWFETYVKTYLRPSTQRKYFHAFKLHLLPRLAKLPLAAITSGEINLLAGEILRKGLKPKSVNAILSALHRCLDAAVDWERLDHVPRFQWLRAEPAAFDFLSSAESRNLLDAARERPYALMIRMALRTGMRIGELLAIRWEDIDFEQRLIAVRRSIVRGIESSPKTRRHRFIPIAADLHDALTETRASSGYVFSADEQGGAPLREPRKGLWRALETAGLRRVGWHVLRHSFASQLVSEGVSIYIVQALLGHSTVQMTMRYAHLAPSATRGAVDVLQAAEERDVLAARQPAVNRWRTEHEQRHLSGLENSRNSAALSKKDHTMVDFFAGAVGET